jgi:alpha-D-ribose 1-methylphosphonate 5-triphosphate synthase subunit PhnI
MAYVAVKGGERAIDNAHAWRAEARRGDPAAPELGLGQIENQLGRAIDRVMAEGSLYDRELAALAIKQAQGDLIEAAFLLRAYRTTLPRFAATLPLDTGTMRPLRRISAVFKDLPGGQLLGPTTDYTHRLLDFSLVAGGFSPETPQATPDDAPVPRVHDILGHEGLIEPDGTGAAEPGDLTRQPLHFPAGRDLRLQALARGDEGFLLSLGYSTQRGYGHTHPFVGEIRMGDVAVEIEPPELGFAIEIGDLVLTECQMVNQFAGSKEMPAQFTRGYGLAFGQGERRAMAMALVDRSLRAEDLGEAATAPGQDVEFVLSHCDNIEATGFVEHLKLPHYVDFQSELETLRRIRAEAASTSLSAPGGGEGQGEVGETERPASCALTHPPHPNPLPPQARAEREQDGAP